MGEDQGQGGPNYYGTFQGVANYWPPLRQPPLTSFPQPAPPPGTTVAAHPATFYSNGYQTVVTDIPSTKMLAIIFLSPDFTWGRFVVGFFFGGIPWYVGTFLLFFSQLDIREKPGYIACAVASVLAFVAMTFGVTKGAHYWWS
ncbi:hypothetical protein CRG98_011576 [Punica granatum]|uniref:60S ribosomal protein L18a-like protein n=1 Tax=Punica granatum TaxID=22663 RepID=A0A2I0KI50_PUNGR|nr:hypothetical protein CRG98_011576 [Punica granatum]